MCVCIHTHLFLPQTERESEGECWFQPYRMSKTQTAVISPNFLGGTQGASLIYTVDWAEPQKEAIVLNIHTDRRPWNVLLVCRIWPLCSFCRRVNNLSIKPAALARIKTFLKQYSRVSSWKNIITLLLEILTLCPTLGDIWWDNNVILPPQGNLRSTYQTELERGWQGFSVLLEDTPAGRLEAWTKVFWLNDNPMLLL